MDKSNFTTSSKMLAIKSFVNTWLKDPQFYCNNCGENFIPGYHVHTSCCENPQFGRNIDHTKGLMAQNESMREIQDKETGATKDNSWRACLSIPPRLYEDLTRFFNGYGEKLFNDERDIRAFMKAFPQFCSCRKI